MRFETLLRRWRRYQVFAIALRALGVAVGTGALVWIVIPTGPARLSLTLAIALVAGLASIGLPRPLMADRERMASHLDRVAPELEDSTGLVIREATDLTGLERLQAKRVRSTLEIIPDSGLWPRTQVLGSVQYLLAGFLIAVLVLVGQARWAGQLGTATLLRGGQPETSGSVSDPLRLVKVTIRPPAYTRQPAMDQESLEIEAVEGSRIQWSLHARIAGAVLDFASGEPLPFTPGEGGLLVETVALQSDVYQLVIGDGDQEVRSAYARLVVIPDESPSLRIVRPLARVTTVEDSSGTLELRVEVEDEHGLRGVELVSTLAQGSGELVEFRQNRQPLEPTPSGLQATLETRLGFSELGLGAGSELYFFAEATDNRQPEPNVGRSATYILRVPGGRVVSADLGEGLPIVLPPEYFRSQRQIILDTEKLIAEERDLSVEEFRLRSEGLGFDQRALRMRYGTLLGEEFESGRPVGAGESEGSEDGDHEHSAVDETEGAPPVTGESPLEGVPADFVHFHDSAEIATFFTSEIRTQLKQVLAQMWDAEGRLRGLQPVEALPFEYRALELLKDLQQRSRIYVQKVGFETPPLEPEKLRLTGELEDIQTRTRTDRQGPADPIASAARELLLELGSDRPSPAALGGETEILVRSAIAHQATQDSRFLLALGALDRWMAGELPSHDERQSLAAALWRLIPQPDTRPQRGQASSDPLAEMYRTALADGAKP